MFLLLRGLCERAYDAERACPNEIQLQPLQPTHLRIDNARLATAQPIQRRRTKWNFAQYFTDDITVTVCCWITKYSRGDYITESIMEPLFPLTTTILLNQLLKSHAYPYNHSSALLAKGAVMISGYVGRIIISGIPSLAWKYNRPYPKRGIARTSKVV